MNTFTVNGKEYKARPFDFNLVCDLEDMGIHLEEMTEKRMSTVRAYFAICAGRGNKFAGDELNAHFVGGGSFGDIVEAMNKEMEASDFFRTLSKAAETEDSEGEETESETEQE